MSKFKHKIKVLTKNQVMKLRSSKYKFIDFEKLQKSSASESKDAGSNL